MIISPISSVTTPGLQAASAINLTTVDALPPKIANNPGLPDAIAIGSNNITVDVSALGELLAYTARLQSRQTVNVLATDTAGQANTTQAATASKADVNQLTAIATSFVDAFNQLQASNSDLAENPLIPTSSDSLLQAMNAGAQNADGSSLFEQLGGIGIDLQNIAQPDSDSFLTLDVNAFQNALAEDPAGTSTLLTQALQVLGSAESTVIAQNQELASGNILTNTNINETAGATSSTESTGTDNNVSNSAASPANLNEDAGAATTNANAELQRALGDEALQVAIDTTRNSQTVVANTNGTNDTANNAVQARPELPASPETTTAAPATSDAANISQNNVAISPAANTSAGTRTATTSATGTDIASNAAVNTLATGTSANSNALSATVETTDIATNQPSQAQGTQASTQTAAQTPSAKTVDTPAVLQTTIATENRLSANPATPSSLLTESQLENQVAANTAKLNESTTSNAASSNVKATLNTPSTFEEVSKTLDTINQATAAANNIAANKLPNSASQASTAVVTPVPANSSVQQTTPVNNSAVVNSSANVTGNVNSIQASINPLISAAVAALRVRDGLQVNTAEKPRSAETDAVTAPEAVTVVEPVTLDLHEHAQNQRHDAEADSAYHQAGELGELEKDAEAAGNINVSI